MLTKRIGATTQFIDDLEHLDLAIKSVSAMLNRYNKADIYIGIDSFGIPTGTEIPDDYEEMILNRMCEVMNTMPSADISKISVDGEAAIHIHATGYETPYSWKGWFYVRRYRIEKIDGNVVETWTENPTCSMKRHRSEYECE